MNISDAFLYTIQTLINRADLEHDQRYDNLNSILIKLIQKYTKLYVMHYTRQLHTSAGQQKQIALIRDQLTSFRKQIIDHPETNENVVKYINALKSDPFQAPLPKYYML